MHSGVRINAKKGARECVKGVFIWSYGTALIELGQMTNANSETIGFGR